mgnify:CR=1 FL=1
MFLFAGLGNPGPKYAGNRHNIGFMALDAICRRHRLGPLRRRFQSMAAEGEIGGEKVIALFPETYMNESGRAVAEAQRFYKIPLDHIFVFHDELDLPPAKLRIKKGGGEETAKVTISLGVSRYAPGESSASFIERADKALYVSKQSGRNQVSLAPT